MNRKTFLTTCLALTLTLVLSAQQTDSLRHVFGRESVPSTKGTGTPYADTLDTGHPGVKIILYDNHTWRYIRDPKVLADKKVFTENWDTKSTNPYREAETLPAAEIKAALTAGFAESLGVAFEPGGLLPEEERRFRALLPHFRSRRWIYGRHDGQRNDLFVHDHKCRGGLIRVSLRLDGPRELIKSACITGDFFLEPERAVLDLEAALKNTSSRPERIRGNILAFFKRASFDAPYLTPEDFAAAVIAAAKRQKEGEHHADEREV